MIKRVPFIILIISVFCMLFIKAFSVQAQSDAPAFALTSPPVTPHSWIQALDGDVHSEGTISIQDPPPGW